MKKIPNSTENFKEFIDADFYFVDKSMLIEHVLHDKVCLFSRPRRFGKTLNMSMLNYFFNIKEKENSYLFKGLKISQTDAIKHQNKYPVIFLTLKDVQGMTFSDALDMYKFIIQDYLINMPELFTSDRIDSADKIKLEQFRLQKASISDYKNSLLIISRALYQHYHQNVIILIDEYDVPLRAAYERDMQEANRSNEKNRMEFYDQMVDFLRSLFSISLKTNNYLFKAIFTGCLRIAKESIFTGTNNFKVFSIFDANTATDFGFTQEEIDTFLNYFSLSEHRSQIKEWYDGYNFGGIDIYNPWSTTNYLADLQKNSHLEPISYWANSSGNNIIYNYIQHANTSEMKIEFDTLIEGKTITKSIKEELTYREIDSIDNIYSFLLLTGYLKYTQRIDHNTYKLKIPNKEVKLIYINTFQDWFKEELQHYGPKLLNQLLQGHPNEAMDLLNTFMERTISYYDTLTENSYHMMLVGLLSSPKLLSNHESGDGRYDIAYIPKSLNKPGFIIECKYIHDRSMFRETSLLALDQIKKKGYLRSYQKQGYTNIHAYGITFANKEAFILMDDNKES